LKLAFEEEGDGPLVVLLHGFPENRRAWRHQIPALARAGFRVVAPDLRGYGDSPKPREIDAYDLREIAGDVIELIESTGVVPCILIGHDWGATVAWFVAMMRPDLIERLAILNIPHPAAMTRELKRNRVQRRKMLYALFFQLPLLPEIVMRCFGKRILRRLGPFTSEELEQYARAWRGSLGPMLNYYRALRRTRGELRKLIRPIEMPVLFIWGEREPFVVPEALEGWEPWVHNLRIERIAHARHFVQHDAPERVNQLLVDFAISSAPSRA
jgi:pimeloyl-ACP methyl ester carboxylesterase